jgi:hypothetical protein
MEGEPAVMVTIGDEFFPMLAKSARITADIADSAIAQFGDAGGIGALAAALRAAADEAERASPAPTEAPTG